MSRVVVTLKGADDHKTVALGSRTAVVLPDGKIAVLPKGAQLMIPRRELEKALST
jgi:hypothetical protein